MKNVTILKVAFSILGNAIFQLPSGMKTIVFKGGHVNFKLQIPKFLGSFAELTCGMLTSDYF